jgi:FG-GAP-like repeat/ASPIC and UnbV
MTPVAETTSMRTTLRAGLLVALCLVVAGVGALVIADPKNVATIDGAVRWGAGHMPSFSAGRASAQPEQRLERGDSFPLFSSVGFETGGFSAACRYTEAIADRGSIEMVAAAIKVRAQRGIDDLTTRLRSMPANAPDRLFLTFQMHATIGLLLMYDGRFDEAADWTERALAESKDIGLPPGLRANLEALVGVIHLRRGETDNCLECLGPSSCIFPIAAEAVHQRPSGSREAIRHFSHYLDQRPDDLGVRWLLNIAYMTLGEYPDRVPPDRLIGLEPFRSPMDVGRFDNVAARAGLTARGPNMTGGSVFDDFSGDGLPDVLTSSNDTELGASLFVNRGDGTFEDRSVSSGLAAQPLAINASHADFDNDGRLDVLLLRGGWEKPARLSLLRNKGAGVFEDVTKSSGLAVPIASHSGAWGDYDNDGKIDLFVCGEFGVNYGDGLYGGEATLSLSDPRNRCRLYRNRGDGTFADVAIAAGVTNNRFAKGAAWGDYDGDGSLDLYVANFGGGNRLYHNRGDGTFEDLAPRLGVTEPDKSFSCWFWDFDNDGHLDLFVNDYSGDLQNAVASAIGQPVTSKSRPRLYRNLGTDGFRDVGPEAGLNRVALAMGSNFGDIDNDGFLDFYLATGLPGYSALVPNLMFKNDAGRRFVDVTTSSRTGHLQKGHGVSFADFDGDGDLDLFVEAGGAVPGDRSFNLLFQNPGHGRHWLKVKLVGTTTNRAALGAKIQVELKLPDGGTRSIYRQVGGASSYGGNSLVETIGLSDANSVAALSVTWPASRSRQTFRNIAADQLIEVTEGNDSPRVIAARPGLKPTNP